MSTILDALKKSERERKLNNIPTLTDMPAPEERSGWSAHWLLALLVILLVLLVLAFAYLGLRSSSSASSASAERVVSNQTVLQSAAENDIVVNVVSWSEQPEQRFVIINGKMVRAGEFVRPGLKVQEIKAESVILIDRGKRLERRP